MSMYGGSMLPDFDLGIEYAGIGTTQQSIAV
jgi:hypothetical protein